MDTAEKTTLTRRDALKTLAAITGAFSLASLPGRWETPLIEAGALPAHAQNSVQLTIETLAVRYYALNGVSLEPAIRMTTEAEAMILDLAGKFAPDNDPTSIYAKVDGCGELVYGKEWAMLGSDVKSFTWNETPSTIAGAVNGVLQLAFDISNTCIDPTDPNSLTGKKFCLAVSHGGRTSNTQCATIINISS